MLNHDAMQTGRQLAGRDHTAAQTVYRTVDDMAVTGGTNPGHEAVDQPID